ncbi:MAG: TRAP transporter small permease [Sneathiella sp.]|nr:TRAP transporter small permease [Sneathiella sp.]
MPFVSGTFEKGWFNKLVSSLNALGSVWIFLVMLLINADAFGRTVFAAPIDGVIEIVELSLVGIVFLQLGDATRRGRLTRSDGFFNLVGRHHRGLHRFMGVLFDGLGVLFMGIILYGSVPLLIESYENDYYVGNEGVFTAPVWPVNTIIVLGCVVTLLQFLVFAYRYVIPGGSAPAQQQDPPIS